MDASRRWRAYYAFLISAGLWPCAALAGAWSQPVGHTQVIVPFTVTRATEDYDANGGTKSRNRFTKQELSPYLEYGYSKRLTLIGSVALTHERSSYLGTTISTRAISRIEAGARYELGTWNEAIFSIQPMLILHGPMSQSDPFASQRGDIDGELGLTIGRNFKWFGLDGFTDNLIALRIRPASRPSEFKANLTLGLNLSGDRQIMLKSESYATFSNGEGASGVPGDIQSNKIGLSFVQRLSDVVSMEIRAMTSVSGRNTIKESSVGFALWYDF